MDDDVLAGYRIWGRDGSGNVQLAADLCVPCALKGAVLFRDLADGNARATGFEVQQHGCSRNRIHNVNAPEGISQRIAYVIGIICGQISTAEGEGRAGCECLAGGCVARYGAALIRHGGGNSVFTAAACIGESDCAFAVGAVGRDRSFTVAPLREIIGEARGRILHNGYGHGLFR